jgi:hypothetical protein
MNLKIDWNSTKQINPPKNQWVLMTTENQCSIGQYWHKGRCEFWDTKTNAFINIGLPLKWARLPKGVTSNSRNSENMPMLLFCIPNEDATTSSNIASKDLETSYG